MPVPRDISVCCRLTGRLLCIAVACFGLAGCRSPTPPSVPAATREGRWRQDIQYFATNLKCLHKDPFRFASEAAFDNGVAALDAAVDRLEDHELIVGLARLAAHIGDLHTAIRLDGRADFHWHPVVYRCFADGTFVVAVAPGFEDLLGSRLLAIEDRPLDEVWAAVATVVSHENDATLNVYVPRYLRCGEVLHALGLTSDRQKARLTLAGPDGMVRTVVLEARTPEAMPTWVELHAYRAVEPPWYLRNREQYYWYVYIAEHRTLYCAYNACRAMKSRPFLAFASEVLRFLDRHPVEKFVLDLRNNGGGNSALAWPLLLGLEWRPKINRRGHLFCLIGNRTMSSGALNALDLKRRSRVLLVGEPTGQKPNSFGELRTFSLPNSGLVVSYSTKFFRVYKDQDPASYMPDLVVTTTFADYAAGRDPVLEAVLAYQPP